MIVGRKERAREVTCIPTSTSTSHNKPLHLHQASMAHFPWTGGSRRKATHCSESIRLSQPPQSTLLIMYPDAMCEGYISGADEKTQSTCSTQQSNFKCHDKQTCLGKGFTYSLDKSMRYLLENRKLIRKLKPCDVVAIFTTTEEVAFGYTIMGYYSSHKIYLNACNCCNSLSLFGQPSKSCWTMFNFHYDKTPVNIKCILRFVSTEFSFTTNNSGYLQLLELD